ncbi:MAG: uL15 family ribosomal protein [Nitrososphaeraceae archaeon]|nr:uL15 family ribosomal protein [Nitrososphaeraceae archaeon]MDW0332405.1 uL15 family ribosomal protein [Nitrososphaeraceae archaeon]
MATRLRKSRKQRGTRYCGWGQIGQHRASGSRGGVGGAGKHKHFWIRTVIEEPDHFGHDSFNSLNPKVVRKWVDVGQLDSLFARYGSLKDNGKAFLDLTALGYIKLLGGGKLQSAISLKVTQFSATAKQKIESAGGEIFSNENHTE